ncbi:flagellar type III secretion system pore protein FliP [Acetivibrio mesophilus]|uniref:Flagellar biosynthetic protein FliP n=1 Tax=Acetivibrio mesophilus TaxID=2487273 RepID=A0A4Q0I782_9FIRM|nr:flagellar type III secretion system pore protein FliP [Acetivibrio mesophilus]ODM25665.1 flagellar biosynthetic protein FliP [Clostridium sp. Bc-iso-3]RXE60251.1 flagellar biosynthetic protein FliP [Acetivibrio mesophilus]HHV29880.1 flagellar type III secretion system pore protein FliP [Clostridium sp.]
MKTRLRYLGIVLLIITVFMLITSSAYAEPESIALPKLGFTVESSDNPQDVSTTIQIIMLLTVLTLAPSILIMMTSFVRIIIVLSFFRNAIGTQQMPPNQVLIGLALFLTLFIMSPVLTEINDTAFKPYSNQEITQEVAMERSSDTIKRFMLKQTSKDDLGLFVSLSGMETPIKEEEIPKLPLTIIIPAFLISELTVAFKIGFLIYLPFLVIDMVVSSTLMSMGMMMLPPVMISLPFKILLFIMVGGWNLMTQMIVNSFVT